MKKYIVNPFTGLLDCIGISAPEPPTGEYIVFADPEVERICIENWSSDGIGLTYEDAAAVTDLNLSFKTNNIIVSFSELQNFIGLTKLNKDDFLMCENLTNIIIPNSVIEIKNGLLNNPEAYGCFLMCSKLSSIIISNSVTHIGSFSFFMCVALTTINIPNSVTSIGEYAFYSCLGLTTINIPNSVTSIEEYAFAGCPELISVELSNSITIINNSTFEGCHNLSTINIPNSVKSIGIRSFSQCHNISSIELPNSIELIGESAFDNCENLTSVIINAQSVPILGIDVFARNYLLENIRVPAESVDAYKTAENWSAYADIITAIIE